VSAADLASEEPLPDPSLPLEPGPERKDPSDSSSAEDLKQEPAAVSRFTIGWTARSVTIYLGGFFALLYFVQGLCEPTEGLLSQPIYKILEDWGFVATQTSLFMAVLSQPWTFKPLFGLLSDFIPLWGSHRWSYLVVSMAFSSIGLLMLTLFPPAPGDYLWLWFMLFLPTLGIAFSDVLVDALMVELGQPRGITGQLQSYQWTASQLATLMLGSLGGYLSYHRLEGWGFAICGMLLVVSWGVVTLGIREPVRTQPRDTFAEVWRELKRALLMPPVLGAAVFIFLWNFNPFSASVQRAHFIDELGFQEDQYGHLISMIGLGAVIGCASYGLYCRKVPAKWLVHLSIVLGVVATLSYALAWNYPAALAVSFLVGATYWTSVLIQFDLAAQHCPPRVAATVFSTLMAISNMSYTYSALFGSYCYDTTAPYFPAHQRYVALVFLGAMFTAGCWLLIPWMKRSYPQWEARLSSEPDPSAK